MEGRRFILIISILLLCLWRMVGHASIDEGLVAYWSFDNGSAIDVSGNGYDGEVLGDDPRTPIIEGPVFEDGGTSCGGVKFQDQPYNNCGLYVDRIKVSKDIKLDYPSYTVTAFFRIDKFCESHCDISGGHDWDIIISRMKNTVLHNWYDAWDLCINPRDRKLYWWWSDDPNCTGAMKCAQHNVQSPTELVKGQLYFVAIRVDNGNGKMILDLQEINSFTTGKIEAEDDTWVCIGCNDYNSGLIDDYKGDMVLGPPGQTSNAFVDELRIYNRALTDDELLALYNYQAICPTTTTTLQPTTTSTIESITTTTIEDTTTTTTDEATTTTSITVVTTTIRPTTTTTIVDEDICIHDEFIIHPRTLNVDSNGKWVTAHLTLSEEYSIKDVDLDSILLEGILKPVEIKTAGKKLLLKFSRGELIVLLNAMELELPAEVELVLTGKLKSGISFKGTDTITVISNSSCGEDPEVVKADLEDSIGLAREAEAVMLSENLQTVKQLMDGAGISSELAKQKMQEIFNGRELEIIVPSLALELAKMFDEWIMIILAYDEQWRREVSQILIETPISLRELVSSVME